MHAPHQKSKKGWAWQPGDAGGTGAVQLQHSVTAAWKAKGSIEAAVRVGEAVRDWCAKHPLPLFMPQRSCGE